MIFEYLNTPCPECSKTKQESHLRFDSDLGKVLCNGETVHEFAEMPGESSPVPEAETLGSSSRSPESETVPVETFTPEDEAALDEAMAKDPRPRDFGNQVADEVLDAVVADVALNGNAGPAIPGMNLEGLMLGIDAPEPSGTQGEVLPSEDAEKLVADYSQCCVCRPDDMPGHYCDEHNERLFSPRLGLGEFRVLANGDAAVCCSIDEKWVSGMQSEAEVQGKTFTEYFQELLNDSLLQWFASVPGVR